MSWIRDQQPQWAVGVVRYASHSIRKWLSSIISRHADIPSPPPIGGLMSPLIVPPAKARRGPFQFRKPKDIRGETLRQGELSWQRPPRLTFYCIPFGLKTCVLSVALLIMSRLYRSMPFSCACFVLLQYWRWWYASHSLFSFRILLFRTSLHYRMLLDDIMYPLQQTEVASL